MFKRFLVAILALAATSVWASEIPALTGPVVDTAKILSQPTISIIDTKIRNVAKSYPANPQITVLTIPKVPGQGIDQYANDVYRAWGLGQKGKDNGVLLVLAPNDRKVRIEVGYGLEPVIPDAVANQIIQHMKPDLKAKNWDGAVKRAVDELIATLPTSEPKAVSSEPAASAVPLATIEPKESDVDVTKSGGNHAFFWFLLVLAVPLIMWYVLRRSSEASKKYNRRYTEESSRDVGTKVPPKSSTPWYTKSPRPRRGYDNSEFTDGLTTGLIVGSASKSRDSDSYRSSSRSSSSDSGYSSSSSSSSSSSWSGSSSSSSSSDSSWSGGGGDSGGGGSSDSW